MGKYYKKIFNYLKKHHYISYTILFLIMCFFMFGYFFFFKKTFIWKVDGYWQYYKALCYYATYLRDIFRNLIDYHKLIIPEWGFNIGEGSDILNTLNYYVIGDPFTSLSILVPTKYMWIYYDFIIVLKIYMSGLSFILLCKGTNQKNNLAILISSIAYAFCSWTIWASIRYLSFLNPTIYFPLIILGIEKILSNKRPYLLIFIVFVSAITNFYFFYMIVILSIIYSIVRSILLYKRDFKKIIYYLFKIGLYSFLGVLLASVIFLPLINYYLLDERLGSGTNLRLLYSLYYYSSLPRTTTNAVNSYNTNFSISSPVLLFIILIITTNKEKNKFIKILLFLSIIMLLVPAFGQIFNGLSYMSNRWTWAITLLISYIMVITWDDLINIDKISWLKMGNILFAYFIICILFHYSKIENTFISLCLILFSYIVISPFIFSKTNKTKNISLLIIIGIVLNGYLWYSYYGSNAASGGVEITYLKENFNKTEANAISSVISNTKDNQLYRYSGRDLTYNINLFYDISNTQYYWTNSNSNLIKYRQELGITEEDNIDHFYNGYDDRTDVLALSSVKYFVTKGNDNKTIPYNYEFLKNQNVKNSIINDYKDKMNNELNEQQEKYIKNKTSNRYSVYENENPLIFVYTYDNYINYENFENYNSVEKQKIMLKSVLLNNSSNNNQMNSNLKLKIKEINYEIEDTNYNISFNKNKIITTSENQALTLNFDKIIDNELYIEFNNFNFEQTKKYDLYFGEKDIDPFDLYNKVTWNLLNSNDKIKILNNKIYDEKETFSLIKVKTSNNTEKQFKLRNQDDQYYVGKTNYTINLGYSEEPITSVTITFPSIGVYTFDSIKVISEPMDDYESDIKNLQQDEITNFKIDTNKVSCTISNKENKIAVFSIPYSTGWKAYVDGKEVEVLQANIKNMGIELEPGTHKIELKYHTPYKRLGLIISCCSFIFLIIYTIIYEKILRNKKYAK